MKKSLLKFLVLLLILSMVATTFVMPSAAVEQVDSIADFGGDHYLICDTDKDMLSYMPGDPVIFTVKVFGRKKQVTVPYLLYTVERDDGTKNSGRIEPDHEGNYIISDYTMDIPGYVRLLIDFPDENGNIDRSARKEHQRSAFEGGVLVDVENITTINEAPKDFEEFWKDSLALLDDLAPDPVEIKLVENNTGYSVYEVYINCVGDPTDLKSGETFAAGYLTVPKNKPVGSLPIRMSFLGYGEHGASRSSSTSAIVMNMCAHSFKLGQEAYDSSLFNLPSDSSGSYGWSASENSDPEDVYFRYMLLRNVQAARFLMKYFGEQEGISTSKIEDIDISSWKGLWNGKELEVSGGSQGGFQSIAMGALCPQVSKVSASIPWFGNVAAGEYNAPTGAVLGSTFIPPYASGLDYYDTAFFASLVTCDTVITGGMGDMTCSPTNLMAMYNNIKRNKNINASITLDQGRTHMFAPDPQMTSSSLSVFKSEVTDWEIKNGVLNIWGNGVIDADFPEVTEWNAQLSDVSEINIFGNITKLKDGVFDIKNSVKIFIKTNTPIEISENSFGGSKDAVVYATDASGAGEFARSAGLEFHSLGALDQTSAFSYIAEGESLKIYAQDTNKPLSTTSGDTALVNYMKSNAGTVKTIEIYGEFSALGNMQPAFSKLENITDIKIDSRIKGLSEEKNFMGLSALVSLGHYDFTENRSTTYAEGIVDLSGFDTFIADGGKKTVPAYILSGCRSVRSVIMPAELMCDGENVAGAIGEKAFADCSSLKTVEFPESVELASLDFGVFSKCSALEKVIVKGSVSEKFSCVLNISTLQSFDKVPERAVFEVTSQEFADIINARLGEGELAIKAVSNGSYKAPADLKNDGNTVTVVIIAVAAFAVIASVVTLLIVLRKKKTNK